MSLVCFSAGVATTSDIGNPKDVSAIRRAVPVLLADGLASINAKASVDWVVTDGHRAIAAWHAKYHSGYVTLASRTNRWWWSAAATRGSLLSDPTKRYWSRIYYEPGLGECGGHDSYGPAARDFLLAGLIDDAIYGSVKGRLRTEPLPKTLIEVEATCDSSFRRDFANGYEAVQSNQTPEGVSVQFGDRVPGQSADLTSVGSSYEFFLKTEINDEAAAPKIFTVQKFRLSIWVPFVLDKRNKYELKLGDVFPAIAKAKGAVRNNTVNFELPVFAMRIGTIAPGEIRVYR